MDTIEHLKWFVLFMFNPQGHHGLNNALLRTLFRLDESTRNAEGFSHLHINNFAWGVPKKQEYGENAVVGSSESGDDIAPSDCHIYIETEKQVIVIYNRLLSNYQPILHPTDLFPTHLNEIATKQGKTPFTFYIKDTKSNYASILTEESGAPAEQAANKPVPGVERLVTIVPYIFGKELKNLLVQNDDLVNMPGARLDNPHLDLFYKLLKGDASDKFVSRLATFYNEADTSYKDLPPDPTGWDEEQAQKKIQQVQELCSFADEDLSGKTTHHHCWLWYPLKFSNRLLAAGLPFVVYELISEGLGAITLDLHYDVADKHWRLDVFRRPGRRGEDVAAILESKGIKHIEVDQQENYVPKYVVLKIPAADDPEEEYKKVQAAVSDVLNKLVG